MTFGPSHSSKRHLKGRIRTAPATVKVAQNAPDLSTKSLWQHEISHARMASCVLRTKIGPVMGGNNTGTTWGGNIAATMTIRDLRLSYSSALAPCEVVTSDLIRTPGTDKRFCVYQLVTFSTLSSTHDWKEVPRSRHRTLPCTDRGLMNSHPLWRKLLLLRLRCRQGHVWGQFITASLTLAH